MVHKIVISGVHTDLEPDIKKYANKKLGGLDRYIPKASKKSAHLEVHLKQTDNKENPFACEVTLYLPHQVIVIKEGSRSLSSAIDITEEKLKISIKKYKDLHGDARNKRRLFSRYVNRAA